MMTDLPVYQTQTGLSTTHTAIPNSMTVMGEKERGEAAKKREEHDSRSLTVNVELDGGEVMSPMELISHVQRLCGTLLSCRVIGPRKFELTLSHPKGKDRLMEGFKVGDTRVHAKEISNDELIVSFLNLPYYIKDSDIISRLASWGVTAVSPIRRRMWPGSNVTDGTRFLRVKFNERVQSLPYSTKFTTVLGSEYFRVLHDRQTKICRICMQPGHIQRECPEFSCHTCGVQGHYSRECTKQKTLKCKGCRRALDNCVCHGEVEVEVEVEEKEEMEGAQSVAESSNLDSDNGQDLDSEGHEEEDESDAAIPVTSPEKLSGVEETAANVELTPEPASRERAAIQTTTGAEMAPVKATAAETEPEAVPSRSSRETTKLRASTRTTGKTQDGPERTQVTGPVSTGQRALPAKLLAIDVQTGVAGIAEMGSSLDISDTFSSQTGSSPLLLADSTDTEMDMETVLAARKRPHDLPKKTGGRKKTLKK